MDGISETVGVVNETGEVKHGIRLCVKISSGREERLGLGWLVFTKRSSFMVFSNEAIVRFVETL